MFYFIKSTLAQAAAAGAIWSWGTSEFTSNLFGNCLGLFGYRAFRRRALQILKNNVNCVWANIKFKARLHGRVQQKNRVASLHEDAFVESSILGGAFHAISGQGRAQARSHRIIIKNFRNALQSFSNLLDFKLQREDSKIALSPYTGSSVCSTRAPLHCHTWKLSHSWEEFIWSAAQTEKKELLK